MSNERRTWSAVTAGQFRTYLLEAQDLTAKFIELARKEGRAPFVGALAALSLVRLVNDDMGGKIEWWCEMLADPKNIERYKIPVGPGIPNLPRGGGRT